MKNTLNTEIEVSRLFKITLVLLFIFIAASGVSKAQLNQGLHDQNRDEIKMKDLREKWDKAQGTFQIQIVNSRINPQVDVAVIEEIEKLRKQEEIVYLPFRDDVRIMILPITMMQSAEFKKLETYKYITE